MLTRMITRLTLCAALLPALVLTAPPARADTRFGSVDDLVRIDVLDGGMTPRGTYQTALRLTLKDGWKTYWRAPGDAGIPPSFSWRGSRNVGDVAITWPAPQVFDSGGLRTIGYQRELVLPVEITPSRAGQPVRLRGVMEVGVCADICVPGTLKFDHDLDAAAASNPAIVAALAQRPYSAREAGVRAATCRLSPTADGIRVEARIRMPSVGGRELAVIEPGDPTIWVSGIDVTRSGDTLTASGELISETGGSFAVDRSQLRFTVLGKSRAVDILGCTPG